MRKLLYGLIGIFAAISVAWGANLPLLSGPQDPSQLIATLNQLIQTINTGVGGLLNSQTAAVSTTATTIELTLQSYTVPANTLNLAGQGLRITCWGWTGTDGNNKTMKLYFGTSATVATPTAATNSKGWFLDMIVMRTAAATQAVLGKGQVDTTVVTPASNLGTEDLTAAAGVLIKCTGTNGTAAAADITASGMIVELLK